MSDIDLMAALMESLHRDRQRRIDNQPCTICGGDKLRPDFTDTERCHAERGE